MSKRQSQALGVLAFVGLYSAAGQQLNQFFVPLLGVSNAIWGTVGVILGLIVLMFVAIEQVLS